MKRVLYELIPAWLLLGIFGLIVIHAPLTVYVGSHWPEIALVVKAWKEILMLVAGILIACDYTLRRRWDTLLRDKLSWWVIGYTLLCLVTAIWSGGSPAAVLAGLAIDLRYVVYFSLVYALLRLYPEYRWRFLRVAAAGAVVVMGFAVIQLVLPHDALKYLGYGPHTIEPYLTVDKNPAFVRENSTLRGPNPLGAYAVIVLSVVWAFILLNRTKLHVIKPSLKFLMYGLGLAGLVSLWVSYSRSALIGALLALELVRWSAYRIKLTRYVWIGVVTVMVCVGIVLYAARSTTFVSNVIVHDNATTGAKVDSNAGHLSSLITGVKRVAVQPLGAGVGSTGSASLLSDDHLIIENQYLFVAHEIGWLGLVLFLGLTIEVLRRLWRQRSDWVALGIWASGIGLAVIGLLLPVWVDDTVAIVWWGLAAVILSRKDWTRGTTTDKKAKRTT